MIESVTGVTSSEDLYLINNIFLFLRSKLKDLRAGYTGDRLTQGLLFLLGRLLAVSLFHLNSPTSLPNPSHRSQVDTFLKPSRRAAASSCASSSSLTLTPIILRLTSLGSSYGCRPFPATGVVCAISRIVGQGASESNQKFNVGWWMALDGGPSRV